MHKVVLLRHGESTWNQENRFTGWTDVDLTPRRAARRRARPAQLLKQEGLRLRRGLHLRAQARHPHALDRARRDGSDVDPRAPHWRLNERHYGALQGLNKAETAAKHGEAAGQDLAAQLRHPAARAHTATIRASPAHDPRYARLAPEELPLTECLKDTVAALPALLARARSRPRCARRARAHRRPRQQPARAGEVPRRRLRRRDRGAEHPDRHPAGVRAGRRPAPDPQAHYLGDPDAARKAAEKVAAQTRG